MSGHSKWDTIKHKKAINDAKKGKVFSKLSVMITHASRVGGGDPEINANLRLYIDKAKEAGFPADRIEKAIQKGVGDSGAGVMFEENTYEGFGPYGVQILIDTLSDNKNRTVAEIRQFFEDIGGRMGDTGSVSWNFEPKGYIVIKSGYMKKSSKFGERDIFEREDTEVVMLSIMDIEGVLDILDIEIDGEKGFEIYTEFNQFAHVRDSISKLGYVIKEAIIVKEAKIKKKLTLEEKEKIDELVEKLEEYDDIQNVWTDLVE